MNNVVEDSIVETAEQNKVSLIQSISDAVESTKVRKTDISVIKDMAHSIGIKNYKDLFAEKPVKPKSLLERYINAKVHKLRDPKKVASFIAGIARAETQEELSEALGIPPEKLYVLIPPNSWLYITTDLFKRFLFTTFSFFIFKMSLLMFQSVTGAGTILSKCASGQRSFITSATLYHQIKCAAGLNRDIFKRDVDVSLGGLGIAQEKMVERALQENAEILKEKVKEKMVERTLIQRGVDSDLAAEVAADYDNIVNQDAPSMNTSMQIMKQEMDSRPNPDLFQPEEAPVAQSEGGAPSSIISPAELKEIEQEAMAKSEAFVQQNKPTSVEELDKIDLGQEVANTKPDVVEEIADAKTTGEASQVNPQQSNTTLDNPPDRLDVLEDAGQSSGAGGHGGSEGYAPSKIMCSALNFASVIMVRALGSMFTRVAQGAYARLGQSGLASFLASAYTSTLIFGKDSLNSLKRAVSVSVDFVKKKARGFWNFISGKRALKMASIEHGEGTLTQETYSKINLNVLEFIKDKYKSAMKHFNKRDLKKMRTLAQDVGSDTFKKIAQGAEIQPSNELEVVVKQKMLSLGNLQDQMMFLTEVQEAQSEHELASVLGVDPLKVSGLFEGLVHKKKWEYIGKAFLFSLYCVMLFSFVSMYLGGVGLASTAVGAKTTSLVAGIMAKLAPLKGTLHWLFGAEKLSFLFQNVARSAVMAGIFSTAITGLFLYGPRWIRNVAEAVGDWLKNKVTSLFNKLRKDKTASSNPDIAMRYFLTA